MRAGLQAHRRPTPPAPDDREALAQAVVLRGNRSSADRRQTGRSGPCRDRPGRRTTRRGTIVKFSRSRRPRRAQDDQHASVEQLSVPMVTVIAKFMLGQLRYAGGYQSNARTRHQYRPDTSRAVGILLL